MALTLANLYINATSVSVYINVLSAACAVASLSVIKEDPQTANHAARLAWAQKTLANPQAMSAKMIWGVLSDPVIQVAMPAPTDAQVQTCVNALIDSYVNA